MVEGERSVQQIIQNKIVEINELFFDESLQLWQQDYWGEAVDQFSTSLINHEQFAEVCDTENPQGVIALCNMPQEIETELLASKKGIILATDGIQDPGNMGTMIRTAAWFGVAGLLIGKGSVDVFHPKVVRSTAGATGTIPHQFVSLPQALPLFEQAGWEAVLLDGGNNSENIKDMPLAHKTIIVVGNEANGINKELIIPGRRLTKIQSGDSELKVESLNAAVAASIALYKLS